MCHTAHSQTEGTEAVLHLLPRTKNNPKKYLSPHYYVLAKQKSANYPMRNISTFPQAGAALHWQVTETPSPQCPPQPTAHGPSLPSIQHPCIPLPGVLYPPGAALSEAAARVEGLRSARWSKQGCSEMS